VDLDHAAATALTVGVVVTPTGADARPLIVTTTAQALGAVRDVDAELALAQGPSVRTTDQDSVQIQVAELGGRAAGVGEEGTVGPDGAATVRAAVVVRRIRRGRLRSAAAEHDHRDHGETAPEKPGPLAFPTPLRSRLRPMMAHGLLS
jgi:hypothetical protein